MRTGEDPGSGGFRAWFFPASLPVLKIVNDILIKRAEKKRLLLFLSISGESRVRILFSLYIYPIR